MKIELPLIEPKKALTGCVLYKGPSQINGKGIICIAVGLGVVRTPNSKTGAMVQTYILNENIHPTVAVFKSKDESICGDCIHRYKDGGSCYVNPANGPSAVYNAYKNGNYEAKPSSDILSGRLVRLGAYGDPCAIPLDVWDRFLYDISGWTGYTHQWRRSYAQPYKKYLMASTETVEQTLRAQKMGWRTFRLLYDNDTPFLPNEIDCPASERQGKRRLCEECLACDGGRNSKASVAIVVHGPSWKVGRIKKVMNKMSQKKKYRGIFNG